MSRDAEHDENVFDALTAFREKRVSERTFRTRMRELGYDDNDIDYYAQVALEVE